MEQEVISNYNQKEIVRDNLFKNKFLFFYYNGLVPNIHITV